MKSLTGSHYWINMGASSVNLGTSIFLRIMKYLTQSRLWIALGAPSVNLGTSILLGVRPSLQMMVIQFLACYAIYSLNMVSDLKEDTLGNPARAAFARRYSSLITMMSLMCVGVAIGIAIPYGFRIILGAFIPFIVGLGYSFGCIPTGIHPLSFTRLKDIPFVKNLTVALTWSVTAVVLQVGQVSIPFAAIIACVVLVSLRFLITSILPDMRDFEADRQNGVKTIPVVCGMEFTLRLTQWLNLAFAACILLCVSSGILGMAAYALLVFAVYGFLYISAITQRGEATPFMCDVVVDGEHVLFGMSLIAVQQLLG